jgi:hypothetical protein
MGPVMFCKVSVEFKAVTTKLLVVPANAGTHNHSRF